VQSQPGRALECMWEESRALGLGMKARLATRSDQMWVSISKIDATGSTVCMVIQCVDLGVKIQQHLEPKNQSMDPNQSISLPN